MVVADNVGERGVDAPRVGHRPPAGARVAVRAPTECATEMFHDQAQPGRMTAKAVPEGAPVQEEERSVPR